VTENEFEALLKIEGRRLIIDESPKDKDGVYEGAVAIVFDDHDPYNFKIVRSAWGYVRQDAVQSLITIYYADN
jgi:hypothetical protein